MKIKTTETDGNENAETTAIILNKWIDERQMNEEISECQKGINISGVNTQRITEKMNEKMNSPCSTKLT